MVCLKDLHYEEVLILATNQNICPIKSIHGSFQGFNNEIIEKVVKEDLICLLIVL